MTKPKYKPVEKWCDGCNASWLFWPQQKKCDICGEPLRKMPTKERAA